MATNIKGPAIFLAQFAGDAAPYNSFDSITKWAASLGYKGVQIPTWDGRLFDLKKAAESKTYCDEVKGVAHANGVEITELSTHLQGQLVAVNPAYDEAFDAFAPAAVHGKPKERQKWAVEQLILAAKASKNLGLKASVTFSGALAWPYVYPWPQRPQGLIETTFSELAKRWKPILDAYDEADVDMGYEIHPGEDVFDGATFEMFLDALKGHKRCQINYDPSHFVLMHLDYLSFIDIYHERICAFHVKDAELNPTGRQGVYSGYQPWINRAGRFRSLGDGQVDFGAIFSKLSQYGYDSWAVLEWECCIKHPEQGAAEGAPFIDIYHERICAFHVKDAELNPTGRQGVYSGYQPWINRAGRFRSLGDGQVDFGAIFSKLSQYGYDSWAVLEWECCIKHPEQGAAEGAPFIDSHLIRVTEKAFDDFAGGKTDQAQVNRLLGL